MNLERRVGRMVGNIIENNMATISGKVVSNVEFSVPCTVRVLQFHAGGAAAAKAAMRYPLPFQKTPAKKSSRLER